MRELTVISGKGGTGKTTIVASFAALSSRAVLADCDVDAADLHLVLSPTVRKKERFTGGKKARIKSGYCTACGKCEELCVFDAVFFDGPGNGTFPKTFRIDPILCEGCGVCAWFCAEHAIAFEDAENGCWFVSDTRYGPMVHARLSAGEENSGKLVTIVRNAARNAAIEEKRELIIIDGSPGIGCPVIASVTGVDFVLAVTEPTAAGFHDLGRVIELAGHFSIPIGVAINKCDINEQVTRQISDYVSEKNIEVMGTVRYDRAVTDAMVRGKSVVEYTDSPVVDEIRGLWARVKEKLESLPDRT